MNAHSILHIPEGQYIEDAKGNRLHGPLDIQETSDEGSLCFTWGTSADGTHAIICGGTGLAGALKVPDTVFLAVFDENDVYWHAVKRGEELPSNVKLSIVMNGVVYPLTVVWG
jgi:hypothetical protein